MSQLYAPCWRDDIPNGDKEHMTMVDGGVLILMGAKTVGQSQRSIEICRLVDEDLESDWILRTYCHFFV